MTDVYKTLDAIDRDILLDYIWESDLMDTIKESLEEDHIPHWSDRD